MEIVYGAEKLDKILGLFEKGCSRLTCNKMISRFSMVSQHETLMFRCDLLIMTSYMKLYTHYNHTLVNK